MLRREESVSRHHDDTPQVNGSYMSEFEPESVISMTVGPVIDGVASNEGVIDWIGSDLVPIQYNELVSNQGMLDHFDPDALSPMSIDFTWDMPPSRHGWLRSSSSTEIAIGFIHGTYGRWLTAPTPGALERTSNNVVYKFLNIINNLVSTSNRQTFLPVFDYLCSPKEFAGEDWSQFSELPDDVALEARLDGRLVMSAVNGFAALGKLPPVAALEFLKRHPASQLTMIKFWHSQSSPLIKAFVENAFRACIAADNIDIVQNLLDTGLIDANKAVCHRSGRRYTPLEYAAINQSFKVIKHLINRRINVNRSCKRGGQCGNALDLLLENVEDRRLALDGAFLSSVKALLEARFTVSCNSMRMAFCFADLRLAFCLAEYLAFRSPKDLLSHGHDIVKNLEQQDAMRIMGLVITKCQKKGRAALKSLRHRTSQALFEAIGRGYNELAETLLQYTSCPSRRGLREAIEARNWKMVKLIREKDPGLSKDLGFNVDENIELFISALKSRDQNRLRSLEEDRVLDHLRDRKLGQALFEALETSNLEYATKLLNVGPEAKLPGDREWWEPPSQVFDIAAALDLALYHNFSDFAWKLLALSTRGRSEILDPRSLLSVAVERKRLDFVKALIESGFYNMTYGPRDKKRSILALAIECGDDSIFDYLWKLRPRDFGPLDDIFKIALEKKPEIFSDLVKFTLPFFRTVAWKVAVQCEKESVFDTLISLGARVDEESILKEAISDHPSMVGPLLNRYWKAYPQGRAGYGISAVRDALDGYSRSPEPLNRLFAWNLVNANLRLGCTRTEKNDLFIRAIKTRNYSIVKKFLFVVDHINDVHSEKCTNPLLSAIETEVIEIVQLLIDHGADVNQTPDGYDILWTPLEKAARINNIPIVRLLLQNNAGFTTQAIHYGCVARALRAATINGNIEIATVLIEHQALLSTSPSPYGNGGKWPLEGAAENGRFDMIEFLWTAPGSFITDEQIQCAIRLAEKNGHFGCKEKIEELAARFPRNGVLLPTSPFT